MCKKAVCYCVDKRHYSFYEVTRKKRRALGKENFGNTCVKIVNILLDWLSWRNVKTVLFISVKN